MVVLQNARIQSYRLPSGPPTDGTREGGWLWLEDNAGHRGVGDFATWPQFAPPMETLNEWAQRACSLARDRGVTSLDSLMPHELTSAPSPVRFAWETAVLDLWGQVVGEPVAKLLHEKADPSVTVNALVSDVDGALEAVRNGFSTLKVKLYTLEEVALVRAIRRAVPADTRIRVDAGGRLNSYEAHAMLVPFGKMDLEYVEDPIAAADTDEWCALARHGAPLAVDQNAAKVSWTKELLAAGAIRTLVLKPMFDGGIFETMTRAREWRALGGEVVVTSALESPVGVAAAVHLACALRLPSACGLTTPVLADCPRPAGGRLAHACGAGLGARPTS